MKRVYSHRHKYTKKLKRYGNNRKRAESKTGGKVLASGGFGCVFTPALKCADSSSRESDTVTKLMTEKHAVEEYAEVNEIREKIDKIPNYRDYFLINDLKLCKPAELTASDLENFDSKCRALTKAKFTKKNINGKLGELMALNMPYGGVSVETYIYDGGSCEKIYKVHVSLVDLLKHGIIPMNKMDIYHCDIKSSNVLVDVKADSIKTRLIDWGLSTEYVPFKNETFPKTWRNRPFQFNVPFSVIIFSDIFVEKYTKYIHSGGKQEETDLKIFVIDYVTFWMKKRGAGHYKFINEIMLALFGHGITTVKKESKPKIVETQITMAFISNYIVDVLLHYTKFKSDGSLDLREYLDNVFIKIVDIWGYMCIYCPIVEIFSNNYSVLNEREMKVFNMLKYMFIEYLYNPRHEPVNMDAFFKDLDDLGDLLHSTFAKITTKDATKDATKGVTKDTTKDTTKDATNALAKGISLKHKINDNKHDKTKKMARINSRLSFKRPPKRHSFRKPIFLALK